MRWGGGESSVRKSGAMRGVERARVLGCDVIDGRSKDGTAAVGWWG